MVVSGRRNHFLTTSKFVANQVNSNNGFVLYVTLPRTSLSQVWSTPHLISAIVTLTRVRAHSLADSSPSFISHILLQFSFSFFTFMSLIIVVPSNFFMSTSLITSNLFMLTHSRLKDWVSYWLNVDWYYCFKFFRTYSLEMEEL